MIEFKLPSLGADMDQGKLLEWKVKPGDPVTRGQVVAIVDTSKAAVEVEIWQDGIVERAWAEDGALRAAPVVTATLAADHRVSDGHRGARFLAALRERLQRPEEL